MEDNKLVQELETPMWMDMNGNDCLENDILGWQVTHELLSPKICLVMDKMGGSTSQKGDGHIGGKNLVSWKTTTPQLKTDTKEKSDVPWTYLLKQRPRDVFRPGNLEEAMCKTGMNMFIERVGGAKYD